MPAIERTAYPRFERDPSASELARLHTPTREEAQLARRATRGEGQPLAFLVVLKSFRRLGYFPKPEEVPEAVVSHLRSRLGLPEEVPADLLAMCATYSRSNADRKMYPESVLCNPKTA